MNIKVIEGGEEATDAAKANRENAVASYIEGGCETAAIAKEIAEKSGIPVMAVAQLMGARTIALAIQQLEDTLVRRGVR